MATTLSDIVETGEPKQVASGFVFTEGPLWHPDGTLTFVDIRRSQIVRLGTDGKTTIIRENSGESNGMTFDNQGRVIICEMVNRRLTRMGPNNTYTVVADKVNGKRFNRPNDVIGKSDGSLYFTNPGRERLESADVDLASNNVLRVKPDGTVDTIIQQFDYPNGLAFSPDEKILYVANTRPDKFIMAYDVNADGTVTNGRHFADMSSEEAGVPDGMKVDAEGRVYCTGPGGCWVFETTGELIGIIKLPEYPANCGWGGPDNKTMYFTANTSVFSMRMKTDGTKIPKA
ncbi:MAG: SMP-30/gluconolactonase/LRE family protein [Chloroflexi bacterium]|nr:SMP-30/gluconolactonase/LRE family protein [Chloroflexota bacterium]MDA1228353.1 SMP-30/gluconolactonase/LRE family protein [Chloroflexota bacterium]